MRRKKAISADILIVDDTIENLKLLSKMLEDQGFSVRPVPSGKLALQAVEGQLPDLILLDISMPEMNGYEVCRRLKSNDRTADIPIIFISALRETAEKIKAFEVGGVDYVTKPFQIEEVHARVGVHLELREARRELKERNALLSENLRMREDIERITRHDLKNPLIPILTLPSAILERGSLDEKQKKYVGMIEDAGQKLLGLLNRSLDLYKMETGSYEAALESVDLLKELEGVIRGSENLADANEVNMNVLLEGGPPIADDRFYVLGEKLLVHSMLSNLIKNSIEASPSGAAVTISLEYGTSPLVSIHNHGAVPSEIQPRFFEKYITSKKRHGTGLGTYSAKLMANVQGADIEMKTSLEKGTTVTIRFASGDKQ